MVSGRPRSFAGTLAAPAKMIATSTAPTRLAMSLTALIEALSPLRYTVGKPGPESTKPVTSQLTWPPASRCPSAGPCTAGTAWPVTALVPSASGSPDAFKWLDPPRRRPEPGRCPRIRQHQRRGERHLPALLVEVVR